MKNATIYLCNAQGSMLGSITGIKADTCSLTQNATDFWELSFEVDRYVEVDGALTQSSYYDSIDDMMRLYLDSESTQAFFVIDSEPVCRGTGLQETKSVTAHSIECELSNVYLKSFKVNCGTSDSQEYLPTDSNGNFYNINPYTGLPYEYISLVNYHDIQLSLLHLVLQNTGWTVKEGIDTVYLDNDKYFKIMFSTVSDPSGSPERAVGYVKKRWSKANSVYAIELQKWDSAAIEFTTKDTADITITAQGIDTISSTAEDTSTYSPITLKDTNENIISNEDGITRVYGNTEDEKGITLRYKGIKPGTYKITAPYDSALNRGVQIKSIIVEEENAAEAIKTQHIFRASNLTSAKDNEEITGICQMKGSFDTSDSVYSFLMKTVSPYASVIFEFDRKHKTVGVVKAADYGKDTGVFITMRNLMNSFEVTSSSQDSIMTKLTPKGANGLGIEYVNFGKDYIINLDYFMNELNEYGDYKFVSRDLHDKYTLWKERCDKDRELYRELTKEYNSYYSRISELRNRVPNDGCYIDYTTYSLEELKTSLTAYKQALAALITAYKNEYGVTGLGDAPGYSPTPKGTVSIKDTPYWYDFYAYRESIIPQIEEALKLYCQTDSNGNLMVDADGNYIELDTGNTDYYADSSIVKTVDSYLYEWSLYGLDELEAKKKAWTEAANILYNECFILSGTASCPTAYRTADSSGWNLLTPEQKASFTSQNAYINQLNSYLDYMSLDDNHDNALTGTKGKGIIKQCEDAIAGRKNEISDLERKQFDIDDQRNKLAQSVTMENMQTDVDANGKTTNLFTVSDLNVIHSMLRETDYSNENILTTNLDDTISEVDVQEDLYQSAVKKLYEISQPQYSFRTELDNLFSLEEFNAYQEPFDVGNYIRVGLEIHEELYDNNYIKLRLISMMYNPLKASESLSVEFSTMTKSLNGISDLAFLLDSNSSSGGSSSSGSSSGSSTYGNNDANVQISNNMLNALLKTEMFGTAVTDVILDSMEADKGKFKTLFAHSGVFDSLETGQIKVSGDCLFDTIKSSNYSSTIDKENGETIETGSMLNLYDGSFSFAGGKLKWDGEKLYIGGELNVSDTITANSSYTGDVEANVLSANSGTIAGWKFDMNSDGFYNNDIQTGIPGKKHIGNNEFLIGDFFMINNEGFSLRDILFKKSINNYCLYDNLTKISGSGNTDYPHRIYVYNYDHFDDSQDFYLFLPCTASVSITFWDSELNDEVHNLFNIVYKYRIKKGQIKNVCDVKDKENSILIEKVNDELLIKSIGYIDCDDLILSESNLDEVYAEDIDGFPPVREHEIYDIKCSRINQENPLSLDKDNKDDYGHKWTIDLAEDKLELLGICYSESIYILSSTVNGMMLDSFKKKIRIDDTYMTSTGFSSKYLYNNVSVSGKPLYINSDGLIGLSGSSERFKNSISTKLTEISSPHGLYDIDIVQYKYNDDYFSSHNDEGIGKYFIGLIAENVAEKFRDGATFDHDGLPDGWDIRYMFPAALKLIQEQHKDIEELKDEIEKIKQK